MMTNTLCSVLNYYRNRSTGEEEYRATTLRNVMWIPSKANNINQSGIEAADALKVYIPFSVNAEGKKYVPPKEYAALDASEVGSYWTLSQGIGNMPDIIVKDEIFGVLDTDQKDEYRNKSDAFFVVTKVDEKAFGSKHMRHWKVGGDL